jgi:hypothetical protein
MEKHNIDFSNRIIIEPIFVDNLPNIALSTKILTYYNGDNWNLVPLEFMAKFPVIYDVFIDHTDNDNKINITIVCCPFTCVSCTIEGYLTVSDYCINGVILMKDADGDLFDILNNKFIDGKLNDTKLKPKRWETEIKIFRNSLSEHPDCKFIIEKNMKELNSVVPNNYLDSDVILFGKKNSYIGTIHPKTLVYVIQYRSNKTGNIKHTIILGKESNKINPTGFNTKESGYLQYINNATDSIRHKNGFVISILWFAWESFYPKAKIIYL